MTYYKLIHGGEIVDAICGADAVWMEENPRSLTIYAGSQARAKGVLSSDGQTTYHLDGAEPFAEYPDFLTVTLEEIQEPEYNALRQELEAGREIVIPQPDATGPDEPAGEQPAPKTRLRILEDRLEAMAQENEMLLECILEMSEVVYGE